MFNRHSIRLQGFDYSQDGLYFVTICTKNRKLLFGQIEKGEMILNEFGKIVESVWESLPKRSPVVLDEFQIMPNHVHLILIIQSPAQTIHESPHHRFIQRGDKRALLPQCIGYLKMNSSKQINQYIRAHHNPIVRAHHDAPQQIFQRNYYESIIRTEFDLNKIREYIKINPKIWDRDRNNTLRTIP